MPDDPVPSKHHSKRGRYNALRRHRGPDDADLIEAERELAAANIEAHIRQVVASAPALSDRQKLDLAALLIAPGDRHD